MRQRASERARRGGFSFRHGAFISHFLLGFVSAEEAGEGGGREGRPNRKMFGWIVNYCVTVTVRIRRAGVEDYVQHGKRKTVRRASHENTPCQAIVPRHEIEASNE